MQLYHGSGVIVDRPDLRTIGYTKDFSYGFYCTKLYEQAVRWANRYISRGEQPAVNVYNYIKNNNLSIKVFPEMSEEWLDFVVACHRGDSHSYDIVEGPMADDTIWNYVEDFIEGDISREAFWALVKFKYPTHQISFHTEKALACLEFVEAKRGDGL